MNKREKPYMYIEYQALYHNDMLSLIPHTEECTLPSLTWELPPLLSAPHLKKPLRPASQAGPFLFDPYPLCMQLHLTQISIFKEQNIHVNRMKRELSRV